MRIAGHCIVPGWPLPPNVHALCSTRDGGVSQGPYASLNLGDHVGDEAAAVAENRRRFGTRLQARPVFMRQVHGASVAELTGCTQDGVEADVCLTTTRGVACTIMVADCLPVLFATKDGAAVAAAHAGWRGLAGTDGFGVVESACRALRSASGASLSEVSAWLGPCIGPQAFEVGPEVKAAFERIDPGAAPMFVAGAAGKWLANLPGLARRRLQALGITRIDGNDGSGQWCTVANPSRFFSHRRDRGVSGRFAAAIWLG
jgi:YfiH family protein